MPAPLIHLLLKSGPLPSVLFEAPILLPSELSASPPHVPSFSHRIQPTPAPQHLSHFPTLPLQDHTNALWSLLTRSCSTQHHLQGAAPWLLYPSLFLLASAKAATIQLCTRFTLNSIFPITFAHALAPFGASCSFRDKPHTLSFHLPCNTLAVSIFVLRHLLQKQLTATSCLMYTNHQNAQRQYITGINSCSRKQ